MTMMRNIGRMNVDDVVSKKRIWHQITLKKSIDDIKKVMLLPNNLDLTIVSFKTELQQILDENNSMRQKVETMENLLK